MALPTQMIGGLISGFDTTNIIEQLMTLERRPIKKMEVRILEHEAKLEAYRGVNNLLLDLQSKVGTLSGTSLWNSSTVKSSNEAAMTATANEYAEAGTYTFRVGRLSQTAQFTSAGFANHDTSAISPATPGEIRIDSAKSRVDRGTELSLLNGGRGVYHGMIKVTDRSGGTAVIDLSTAETMTDVINAINNADGVDVTAGFGDDGAVPPRIQGDRLTIFDESGGAGTLRIENYGGGSTATDLGIAGTVAADKLTGQQLMYLGNNTPLSALRDGLGINSGEPGEILIMDGLGGNWNVDLSDASTMGDVIATINTATGGAVTAALSSDKRGLTLTGGAGANLTVGSLNGGSTAEDLGIVALDAGESITGENLLADLNSVQIASLSGANGTGINGARGSLTQTLGDIEVNVGGTAYTLGLADLTGSDSLTDLVNRLNWSAETQLGAGQLTFSINRSGNGIQIANNTGSDVTFASLAGGTAAEDLGFTGTTIATGGTHNAGDLDRNYISMATKLSDLNGGSGVHLGQMRITDATGSAASFDLSTATTLGDVINGINDGPLKIKARINDTGDGILIYESPDSGGTDNIKIEEMNGGTAARDLGLLGSGTGGDTGISTIDGSFERTINIAQTDTLQDVMNKIVDSGAGVMTSIINDGSAYAPYRLVVTSENSGAIGDLVLDTDLDIFGFSQTSRGRDSVLLYGQAGSEASPILLTSPTNSNNSAVLGLTIDMNAASSQYTTITVSKDTSSAATAVEELVTSYNNLHDFVGELDTYDPDDGAGLLFADSAVRNVMSSVTDLFFGTVNNAEGNITSLFDLGVSFSDKGNLEVDSLALSAALRDNHEGVRQLMTQLTDVARKDLNVAASASSPAGGGTSVDNVINGQTSSSSFGVDNGYESTDAIPAGGQDLTIHFGSAKKLSRLVLNHINSSSMPAEDYALKDFRVEYFDAVKNSWETLRNVSGNKSAYTYLNFAQPTAVSALRIHATSSNAADNKFRLVEVEAFEQQGLATNMKSTMSQVMDSTTGFFAEQQERLEGQIKDIKTSIEKMEERAESVEIGLIRQYAAMESAMAQLQTQGNYFMSQMDAWNSSQKK